jgi:hypothetical protein
MKLRFISFIAALVLVTASAFTFVQKTEAKKDTTYFYRLMNGGNPLVESHYTTKYSVAPDPCEGDDTVCWIEAEDNGSDQPEITSTLEDEIEDALFYHTNGEHVILRD